jgi:hypothetical protein
MLLMKNLGGSTTRKNQSQAKKTFSKKLTSKI